MCVYVDTKGRSFPHRALYWCIMCVCKRVRVWHTCWNTKCYIHLNNMKTYQTKYQWGILYSVRLFFCVVAKRNDSLKAIMLFLTPTTLNLLKQIHTLISLFFRKVLCVSSVGNNSNWTLKTLPFQSLFLTHLKSILLKIFLKLSQDVVSFYYKDIRYICWLLKLNRKQENNNNKRWNQ